MQVFYCSRFVCGVRLRGKPSERSHGVDCQQRHSGFRKTSAIYEYTPDHGFPFLYVRVVGLRKRMRSNYLEKYCIYLTGFPDPGSAMTPKRSVRVGTYLSRRPIEMSRNAW